MSGCQGGARVTGLKLCQPVERQLIAADVSRKKRAAVIDQHAAIFILQGALDRLAQL